MTAQYKQIWQTIIPVSLGLILGVGAFTWMTQQSSVPQTQAQTDSHDDRRLAKLEHAVMVLTQAVQNNQAKAARPELAKVPTPANSDVSRSELAQVIREEVRRAMANNSPEAQRAKEEAIAEAQILNSPENKAAYHSASSVVQTAVAAKRWTEDDKETFRAFGQLTNNQRMKLINVLTPAINNGHVEVEVMGPLF
jgi:type IV secretory pathway VirB10-like protein